MIVYKSRRYTVRRYAYEVSGIVEIIGYLLARYATKAMLITAAKTAIIVDMLYIIAKVYYVWYYAKI